MSITNEITRLQTAKADIKAAIESKGITVGDGTIDTYAEKIVSIETGGGIDLMLYARTIPDFSGVAFPENTEITINIPNFSKQTGGGYTLGSWSNSTGLKKLKLISSAEITEGIAVTTTFNGSTIEELDLTEFPRLIKNIISGFLHCRNLKRILGELNLTNCTFNGYEFYNCDLLEELYIEEGTLSNSLKLAQSSKLIDISIQSIVKGFADMTGKTAPTLTVHPTVGGKFTDEQKATLTAKNVILVY